MDFYLILRRWNIRPCILSRPWIVIVKCETMLCVTNSTCNYSMIVIVKCNTMLCVTNSTCNYFMIVIVKCKTMLCAPNTCIIS